jgi:hypothetical protein
MQVCTVDFFNQINLLYGAISGWMPSQTKVEKAGYVQCIADSLSLSLFTKQSTTLHVCMHAY